MIDLKPFQFFIGTHRDQKVIFIKFDRNFDLIQQIKQLTGSKWSNTQRSWYVPDVLEYRKLFGLSTDYEIGKFLISKIHPVNQIELQKLVDQLNLYGYSQRTIRCYTQEVSQFLYYIKDKKASECDIEDIKQFLLHCINELKLKENTIHSRINGIKFYYEEVLKQTKIALEIPRPKKHKKLPKALHPTEVKAILNKTNNLKHNTILKLCYGMGLRVSEIVNIKIIDIDGKNLTIHIQRGKGKKDRYVYLPESILPQLRKYYLEYKPKEYLFEGQYGGQYSTRSVQKVFKECLYKANIRKPVGIHSLRHSYATHLLENGTDIRFIQELLGHNDIKTTLIYTNVTDASLRKVVSPLDYL